MTILILSKIYQKSGKKKKLDKEILFHPVSNISYCAEEPKFHLHYISERLTEKK